MTPPPAQPKESRRAPLRRRGQAMTEYVVVLAALFGIGVLGWPFFTQMIDALDAYYQSVYYVIQSPLP